MKRIIIIFLIFALCSLFSALCQAQVTQEWVARYPNASAHSIAMDTSGNVYVVGSIAGNNGPDFLTIKYNHAGEEQWHSTYSGPGTSSNDFSIAICVDKIGNVYVTGSSEQCGAWTDAFCTIKYNVSGVQQWVARYQYSPCGQDDPVGIAVDDSGNVYVAGSSQGIGYLQGKNYCTIKYNSNGDSVWVRRYAATGNPIMNNAIMYDMKIDDQANVYVSGESVGYYGYYYTIKYNTNGVQQWAAQTNVYGSSGNYGYIALDKYNNLYLTCTNGSYGLITIKYNSNGVQQWIVYPNISGISPRGISGIVVDTLSNIYLNAFEVGIGGFSLYITIKYSSSGDTQWVRTFNPPGSKYNYPYGICLDKYLNTYITGGSMDSNNIGHITTLKYNNLGTQQWIIQYPGVQGNCVISDKSSNVYVAGHAHGSNDTAITIKYSQPNGLRRTYSQIPMNDKLYQNYPNPFNPRTIIKYDVKRGTSNVKLSLFDIGGKHIINLVNQKQNPGTYEVDFSGTGYSSGIYFYSLIVDGKVVETKKMILLK